MAEYIERESTIATIEKVLQQKKGVTDTIAHLAFLTFIEILKVAPTADVVEVVRCKDCERYNKPRLKYCSLTSCYMHFDDFCSYGKRKEGAEK